VTDRLKQCLAAGDVLALFPLLKYWPKAELVALLADTDAFYDESQAVIDKAYQELAFRPENFLSGVRSGAIDKAVEDKRMEVLAMCSEIASVAFHYLEEKC